MNAHMSEVEAAAGAVINAIAGEAVAANGYITAYETCAAAVHSGAKESDIAKAIKQWSTIKAGADLVGDFVLTAPLVAGDGGTAAHEWIRGKFGADTVKRVHTVVTAARVAKGQGKPVVRSILAPVVAILEGEFDPDAYAAAVARALTALSKVKPVQIDDTDTDTDDVEQDGADTDGAGEDVEPTADAMLQALAGPTVALRKMLESGAMYDIDAMNAWLSEAAAIARMHANAGAAAA